MRRTRSWIAGAAVVMVVSGAAPASAAETCEPIAAGWQACYSRDSTGAVGVTVSVGHPEPIFDPYVSPFTVGVRASAGAGHVLQVTYVCAFGNDSEVCVP